ncbi:MAG: FHA domain-containing protein, partial [Halobacteria archaeon]|nr:FHA domain-containing protein [Halobacteria archaeon]
MAELIIRQGPDSGARTTIEHELTLGRSSHSYTNDQQFFRLSDAEISRRHMRIFQTAGSYFVEDLHSTNGTLLQGKFLKPGEAQELKDGDELYLGNSQAVFRLRDVPATQPNVAEFDLAPVKPGRFRTGELHVLSKDDEQPDVSMIVDASQILMNLRDKVSGDAELNKELVKRMQAMVQVSIALGAITDLDELLANIMKLIFEIFEGADRAFVVAYKAKTNQVHPLIMRNRDSEIPPGEDIALSRTIINQALEQKHALLLMDALGDQRFSNHDSIQDLSIRSVMCAPLLYENDVLGLIQVDTRQSSHVFTAEDLEVLTGISAQMAISMKNSQLYQEIEGLFEGFVTASVQAIEARDPSTAGHSFRVADHTEQLAMAVDRTDEYGLRDISFSREQLQEVRYAALLHDFGKVGVREHILTKAKKLYPHEMAELKLRIKYAKACMERKAYKDLVDLYQNEGLSPDEFQLRRNQLDEKLRQEIAQLNEFLVMILEVNEPEYQYDKNIGRLHEINNYHFSDRDEQEIQLLTDFEFSVLSFSRGSLNPEERREIESHVSHTFEFLSLIPWTGQFAGIPDIAHAHHEKLDGTGYPQGLLADQIPAQSKIMAIADIYDALTAGDRPYHSGVPTETALHVIEKEVKLGKLDEQM